MLKLCELLQMPIKFNDTTAILRVKTNLKMYFFFDSLNYLRL
jgi:hypothetical protein